MNDIERIDWWEKEFENQNQPKFITIKLPCIPGEEPETVSFIPYPPFDEP